MFFSNSILQYSFGVLQHSDQLTHRAVFHIRATRQKSSAHSDCVMFEGEEIGIRCRTVEHTVKLAKVDNAGREGWLDALRGGWLE